MIADRNAASVVGDSLIASSAQEQRVAIDALGYVTTVRGFPGVPLTSPFIEQAIELSRGTSVVVIATATNDNYSNYLEALLEGRSEAQALYRRRLERVGATLAGSCVVWVNARTQIAALYHPEETDASNETLARFVEAHRNTRLVDWAAISTGHDHTDWFAADELHFNRFYEDEFGVKQQDDSDRRQSGVDAYAAAIADGVRRCSSSPTTSRP